MVVLALIGLPEREPALAAQALGGKRMKHTSRGTRLVVPQMGRDVARTFDSPAKPTHLEPIPKSATKLCCEHGNSTNRSPPATHICVRAGVKIHDLHEIVIHGISRKHDGRPECDFL